MAKRERAAPVIHDDGFTINGCAFHVDPKYKPIDAIGQGSYGVVCSVRNAETNEKLAIKKITPMAGDEWDATHTLREIRLMRCLGAHENIISLKDLSMCEEKDELYMMMELADTDLHRLIQSSCPLTEGHIRVIMFQLLSGVKAMHDNGVLHRDLKPGNLLLNKDCELKITDFGLARMTPKEDAHAAAATDNTVSPMTEYVVTRWYRPPELMLAPNGCYDGAVDMWSVGCILGELLNRKPLFPGTDFMDQLTRVFKVVAIPDKDQRGYTIEKDALKFLQSLAPTPENAMDKLFKHAPAPALDLLRQLLCFNPKERLSAEAALAHPFFEGVQEEWGEIKTLKLGHSLEFAFEQQSLPLATLRQYICNEVRAFQERDDKEKKANEKSESHATTEAKATQQGQSAQALRVTNDMPAGRGFTIKGCDFNVPAQYKPLQVLGEGSYGIVCAATDTLTKKNVAIKKITPMAGDEWDAKHTLREIRLMRYFGHHPNIASLHSLSTCTEKDELYLMMDLVDTDLHRLIQSKTKLEEAHIAAIMYQLLCGAKALHENGVLHRDLKPGNLLVSKNCDVKITDFGLSRYLPHGHRPTATNGHEKGKDLMTEYVVTRWYRAPEIMLAPNGTYGEAIDMWSIGCIFGELLNRKPLFPGSDFIDQLTRVFSVLPVPSADKRGYNIEGDALKFLESLPPCSPDALTKLFRKASPEAVSLLRRLLCINPERRVNAKQALAHPYFKAIRAQLGEPPEFHVPKTFDFEFDYQEFPLSHLRQLIQDEVRLLQQPKESQDVIKKEAPANQEKEKKETKTMNPSPITTTETVTTSKPAVPEKQQQEEESDNEQERHQVVSHAPVATTKVPSDPQRPESDDEDDASEVSEASSGRLQQQQRPTTATTTTTASIPATTQQKKPADPQDDIEDDRTDVNDNEEEEEQEIIQVERSRRPVNGKLERPRSATGTAASAAAARRAATHREEEQHRPTVSHQTRTTTSSNNESTERWGHPRAATTRYQVAQPSVHSTSSGATAILNKRQPLNASAAAASRLLTARTAAQASHSSNQTPVTATKDQDEKSDAYRHPERASTATASRTTTHSTARATSAGLTSSSSAKDLLPDGWVKRIHSRSGKEYYYDTLHKVSSWKHPGKMDNIFGSNHDAPATSRTATTTTTSSTTASRRTLTTTSSSSSSASLKESNGPSSGSGKESNLPKDWERRTDPKTGRFFYVNLITKKTFARLPSSVSASMLTTSRESTNSSSSSALNGTMSSTTTSKRTTATTTTTDPLRKKTTTKAQSPQFSQMSWQKRRGSITSVDE
ncbi:hypothetical protein Poli38472_010556 [Pythium oligandrum]|uniref:CMGC/MAPK protein kinase n=1 Tax=Pythium oligandrum TaxID=41045 RepID=A0A8K1C384_PYTOL|nr:hypothetical protein Poli38472_010556 [Pythium oligandrum]|eukprot:TMW55674.1 hypothetical protein Poli38472_010556 [Pythium oligandrum]